MKNWVVLVMIIGVWFYLALAQSTQEELAITTYYPVPYASYNELIWGCRNRGQSVARLVADEGGSIELGGYNCSGPVWNPTPQGRPYINFYATNWRELRASIRSRGPILEISGNNPTIFRAKIVGGLYVDGALTFNATNPNAELRGRLGKGSCYWKQASNEDTYSGFNRNTWCNDGDYIAGINVFKIRGLAHDSDQLGIYLICCAAQ